MFSNDVRLPDSKCHFQALSRSGSPALHSFDRETGCRYASDLCITLHWLWLLANFDMTNTILSERTSWNSDEGQWSINGLSVLSRTRSNHFAPDTLSSWLVQRTRVISEKHYGKKYYLFHNTYCAKWVMDLCLCYNTDYRWSIILYGSCLCWWKYPQLTTVPRMLLFSNIRTLKNLKVTWLWEVMVCSICLLYW